MQFLYQDRLCDEVTSGDTVGICFEDGSRSGRQGSATYTLYDEKSLLVAVVDSNRKVFSHLRITTNVSSTDQRSATESLVRQEGRELVLRDVPYVVNADGSFTGTLSGAAILPQIVRFDYFSAENLVTATTTTKKLERVRELLPAADSKIVITLERTVQQ